MEYSLTASWNVRNEEQLLGYSIMSCKNIADEFIVVDHGSTDNTLDIVKKCEKLLGKEIKVYHFDVKKPEPDAKNFKFDVATKDWVLWIDGDEIFTYSYAKKAHDIISEAIKQDRVGIYLFMLEFVNDFKHTCMKSLIKEIGGNGQGHRPRIFKKGCGMHVDGSWRKSRLYIGDRIHQQCRDDLMMMTDILIYHYDRLKTNKEERYLKVLNHVKEVRDCTFESAKAALDDKSTSYYSKSRNIDNVVEFTGEQPEVFKEYDFYDLKKLKGVIS